LAFICDPVEVSSILAMFTNGKGQKVISIGSDCGSLIKGDPFSWYSSLMKTSIIILLAILVRGLVTLISESSTMEKN
jgi:hypothetical protein